MLDDEFLREILALQSEVTQRTERYLENETTLRQVARSPLPDSFTLSEPAAMTFAADEIINGDIHITWPDRRLKASFHRRLIGPTEIPGSNTGTARIAPATDSRWTIEAAHVDDVHVRAERNDEDVVIATIDESLNARRFRREFGVGPPRFHRTIFRGGNLDGYPHEGFDVDAGVLQFNECHTEVFGRPSVIRSICIGRNPDDNMLSITFEGDSLTTAQSRAIWLLLSFFTGPRLEIVAKQDFDAIGAPRALFIPNGVGYSGGAGKAPLRTGGPTGTPLAQQFPGLVARVESELAAGFPWHVAFHHLEESYSAYPESAVKNLAVALDTVIEAHIGDVGKDRFISKTEYKEIINPMLSDIRRIASERGYPDEFVEHMQEVLARENHRGTTEKRNMFWAEFGIDIAPYSDVLAFRDDALHTGHVLDYLKPIDYIEFSKDVDRLRTIVNRAFLRRLGYAGPMLDVASGAVVDV